LAFSDTNFHGCDVEVLSREELPIRNEDDIVLVRRRVRAIASEQKLDSFATAAVTTATSELTRNAWVHGGGGEAVIEQVRGDDGRVGMRVVFRDRGPGIADIARVLRGGFSTARSMGLGLSGSRRLVDELVIESQVGHGTMVMFVKWKPF
jgi:serine/threonine-protein kinase RsbT